MRTVTENALTVTQQIIADKRKDVQFAKEWVTINKTGRAYRDWNKAKDELAAMERIMLNLGLECE